MAAVVVAACAGLGFAVFLTAVFAGGFSAGTVLAVGVAGLVLLAALLFAGVGFEVLVLRGSLG